NVRIVADSSITRSRPFSEGRSQENSHGRKLQQATAPNRRSQSPVLGSNAAQRTISPALQRLPSRMVSRRHELSQMSVDQLRMECDERPWNRMVIHRVSSLLASRIRKGHSL